MFLLMVNIFEVWGFVYSGFGSLGIGFFGGNCWEVGWVIEIVDMLGRWLKGGDFFGCGVWGLGCGCVEVLSYCCSFGGWFGLCLGGVVVSCGI